MHRGADNDSLVNNQIFFVFLTGSGAPIPCPGGEYCQIEGLALPTNPCSAGYYCTLGATIGTPTDGNEGDICPAGYYCEEGSPWPTSCPPGTYSPSVKNENITDCVECSLGEYCGDYNLTEPSGR